MSPVSDIKLIRTDTTLDLSQKAEKGILLQSTTSHYILLAWHNLSQTIWGNTPCKYVSLTGNAITTWDGMPNPCLPHVEMRVGEINRKTGTST